MDIHLYMDGTFSAMVYSGEYDLQLADNTGPWVSDTTRIPVVINGDTQVDIPVRPYYTIEDENIVFTPPAAGDTTGGRITATFRVGEHVATPLVDLVGLYISTTTFVDRNRRDTSLRGSWTYPLINPPASNPTPSGQSANNPHERVRAQIQDHRIG
jgi:hypothetical protein